MIAACLLILASLLVLCRPLMKTAHGLTSGTVTYTEITIKPFKTVTLLRHFGLSAREAIWRPLNAGRLFGGQSFKLFGGQRYAVDFRHENLQRCPREEARYPSQEPSPTFGPSNVPLSSSNKMQSEIADFALVPDTGYRVVCPFTLQLSDNGR